MLPRLLPAIFVFFACQVSSGQARLDVVEEKNPPFPGYLYRPKGNKPYPALILLHGSRGGSGGFWYKPSEHVVPRREDTFMPRLARAFAGLGYVTYALCYFDCRHHPGYRTYPPDELIGIDISKTTEAAVSWLRRSPFSAGKKVALLGGSRGAEQALLLAILSEPGSPGAPDAVIALSPPDLVVGGFSKEQAAAVKRGGEFVLNADPVWSYGSQTPKVFSALEIERYKKPLMLTFFDRDPNWGPQVDPRKLVDRLKKAKMSYFSASFKKERDHMETYKKIRDSGASRIVLHFAFDGHVTPPAVESEKTKKKTEAFILQSKAIQWFLNAHLNPSLPH